MFEFSGKLHELFEKKKFGDSGNLTREEVELLRRFKHSRLIKALVDPSVGFELEKGFVPSRLEWELAYSVVSSRPVPNGIKFSDVIRVVTDALRYCTDLQSMLFGKSLVS